MAQSYICFLLILISFSVFAPRLTNAKPPAIFIFGDSTADVGTNTLIPNNLARADFPYHGVDLNASNPTGRFSNGFITVDFLSMLMGYERSPEPFLLLNRLNSTFQPKQFRGVNFASGGSGLLNITSKLQKVVPIFEQVNQFMTVQRKLAATMGQSPSDYLLSKSVFIISIGSNDILEYFDTNNTMPKEQFISSLMTSYDTQIRALYRLGARKFGLISVLPMGCCPNERLSNETGGCLEAMNVFSLRFYRELDTLLTRISPGLRGLRYSLGNTYRMVMNVLQNPARYNFTNVESACCGSGRLNAEEYCNASSNLCANRNEYAFWDGSHPTQAASRLAARALYNSQLRYANPIDFSQLAADN